MLGVRKYPKEYIAECRAKVTSDLTAYKRLAVAAKKQAASVEALEAFETTFFNNMLIALEHCFVHRLRTVEGKDGNPLNEVRMLCDSMLSNHNRLGLDKTIKYDPDKTVLKIKVGDQIRLTEADFRVLSKAFFAEIESKFL